MNHLPETSVIICTYSPDRSGDLRRAIDSVRGQVAKVREVVVVVDGNEELARRLLAVIPPEVTLVANRGLRGLSGARNTGVRSARGEVIAFLDDDAWAEPEWSASLARAFRDPNVVAVSGRIIPAWPAAQRPLWFPEELDWIVGCSYAGLPLLPEARVRNVIGCNMAFRRSVFDRVGYFRSALGRVGAIGQAEETELCLRIRHGLAGAVIRYEPSAVVHHRVTVDRTTPQFLLRRSYHEGYCKGRVRRLQARCPDGVLTSESMYLRHLVTRFVPDRLSRIFHAGSLAQLAATFLSAAAVGVGYLAAELVSPGSDQRGGLPQMW